MNRNYLALATLALAKVLGLIGLALGYTQHRTLGGVLLGMDGVLLVVTVILAAQMMRGVKREEETQKDVLEKMIREGTLQQYLRDIEAKKQGDAGKAS
jgi:uncharacterized membrane protein required for colicin V production